MSVRGWAQGCAVVPRGSSLVVDAPAGSLVLAVEDITDYDDAGGTVLLNDEVLTYSEGGVDDDAGTITLDAATTMDALIDDAVTTMTGGKEQTDKVLSVSCGDGDLVEVTVPFEQRNLWPEGDYDDPVQVTLSDDLEQIVGVPGHPPTVSDAEIVGSTVRGGLVSTSLTGDEPRVDLIGDQIRFYYSAAGYSFIDPAAGSPRTGTSSTRWSTNTPKSAKIDMVGTANPLSYSSVELSAEEIVLDGNGNTGDINNDPHGVSVKGGLHVNGGADITGDVSMFGMGTTTNSPNMFIGSGGLVRESVGSSERFKDNIVDLDIDLSLVRLIRNRAFTYQAWYYEHPEEVFWGLIGEELEALGLGKFVDFDEDGQVINVRYAHLVIAVLALAQNNADRLDDHDARFDAQQAQIDALTARLYALEAGS